jgi:hypothetical protein
LLGRRRLQVGKCSNQLEHRLFARRTAHDDLDVGKVAGEFDRDAWAVLDADPLPLPAAVATSGSVRVTVRASEGVA